MNKKHFIQPIFLLFILSFLIGFPCFSAAPVYSPQIWISDDTKKPDEYFDIKIYISGEGSIASNRMKICSEEEMTLVMKESNRSGCLHKIFPLDLFNKTITYGNFHLSAIEVGELDKTTGRPEGGAMWYQNKPPLTIKAKAPSPGDYRLNAMLLYSDTNNQYYLKEKEVIVHISSFYERNQWWITPLIIIISILSLFFGGLYSQEIKRWIRKPLMNTNASTNRRLIDMIQRADSGWLRLLIIGVFSLVSIVVFSFAFLLIIKGVYGEFTILNDFQGWKLYITSVSPGLGFVIAGTAIMCWGLPKTIKRLHR